MKNDKVIPSLILGLTVGIGIAFAGYFLGSAIFEARTSNRYVTVKGLAERGVDADLVIWPIAITETGNDLSQLQFRLDSARLIARTFLRELGFEENEMSESPPRIIDYYAQGYTGSNIPKNRYKADFFVTLRTTKVSQAKKAMGEAGTLVKKGIVLAETYGQGAEFLFTGLNKIKPEMIAEATKDARKAAEQFARDSGSTVGSIRTARQGFFTISNRDMNSPDYKIVRVVTTIDYYLVSD